VHRSARSLPIQLERDGATDTLRLLAHREAKELQPQIAQLRRLIKDIENATEAPELRTLK
jgi:hypothetical protein